MNNKGDFNLLWIIVPFAIGAFIIFLMAVITDFENLEIKKDYCEGLGLQYQNQLDLDYCFDNKNSRLHRIVITKQSKWDNRIQELKLAKEVVVLE